MSSLKLPAVRVSQQGKTFFLTSMTAGDLVFVSYVARRGVDKEKGAVQRLLNPSRINSIRDFVLSGGVFPTSIILNWTAGTHALKFAANRMTVPKTQEAAQIIDGQHRVLGLAEAIAKKSSLKSMPMPVSIYDNLSTKACADIFLAINTEQKPVARSLVFDLYSLASDYIVDPAALRAGDVAKALNEQQDSPYAGFIKFPGAPTAQKGLALSTVVSALKPLVEPKGVFEQVGLTELHMQVQFLINAFGALRDGYGIEWESASNVFRAAAGFVGAIEFIKNKLVVHCNIKGDFTSAAIKKVLPLSSGSLIRRDAIEGLQGRRAFTYVSEALGEIFDPTEGSTRKIKV